MLVDVAFCREVVERDFEEHLDVVFLDTGFLLELLKSFGDHVNALRLQDQTLENIFSCTMLNHTSFC